MLRLFAYFIAWIVGTFVNPSPTYDCDLCWDGGFIIWENRWGETEEMPCPDCSHKETQP